MQRVGLSLQPEQFEKLAQLVNTNAIEIAEISSQPDNESDQALVVLAELLRKTYHETQQLLDRF